MSWGVVLPRNPHRSPGADKTNLSATNNSILRDLNDPEMFSGHPGIVFLRQGLLDRHKRRIQGGPGQGWIAGVDYVPSQAGLDAQRPGLWFFWAPIF